MSGGYIPNILWHLDLKGFNSNVSVDLQLSFVSIRGQHVSEIYQNPPKSCLCFYQSDLTTRDDGFEEFC